MTKLLALWLAIWLALPAPGGAADALAGPACSHPAASADQPMPCCPGQVCEPGSACCLAAVAPASAPSTDMALGEGAWPGHPLRLPIQPPLKRLERPPRPAMSPV